MMICKTIHHYQKKNPKLLAFNLEILPTATEQSGSTTRKKGIAVTRFWWSYGSDTLPLTLVLITFQDL